jgi:hypothetical protein
MSAIPLPALLMGALSIGCLIIVYAYLKKAIAYTKWTKKKKDRVLTTTLVVFVLWLTMIGVLAARGFFADFSSLPPRPVMAILLPLPIVLVIAFSKGFRSLAAVIPPHWFILFQSFRILVELLLWQAFLKGLLPVQMSFEGRNWDIMAGILGLFAGLIVWKQNKGWRSVAVIYNVVGLGLLINVLVVALLSMPTSFRYFLNEPSVEKIGRFPMIYLPAVLVVLAYSFHIFSLRQLWLAERIKQTIRAEKRPETLMH